jgi:hypothetical protein
MAEPTRQSRGSAVPAAEQLGCRGRDLVGGNLAKPLGDVPAVTERVDDLAVELAPELLGDLVASGTTMCGVIFIVHRG